MLQLLAVARPKLFKTYFNFNGVKSLIILSTPILYASACIDVSGLEMYTYDVLHSGYSRMNGDSEMIANCSCTLVRGPSIIIVDTMTPWDSGKILQALSNHNVTPEDISYVVSTHGHSDHTGNNNLFLQAKHIVGHSVSFKDTYFLHSFDEGTPYVIDEYAKILPTPGHTLTDVTLVVETAEGAVAVAGDLFECYEDIKEPNRWLDAGSEAPHLQRQNRRRVAQLAEWIVPGHGGPFRVTEEVRRELRIQAEELSPSSLS